MSKDPPKGSPEYFEKYPWALVEEPVKRAGSFADEEIYTHPAYGQLEIVRTTGYTELYDSEFKHSHFITIRLYQSELHRNLARDWHMAGHRAPLAEINLSEAQWATFVSAVGTGGGVPCTIKSVDGRPMPRIPERRQEPIYKQEGETAINAAVRHLEVLRDKVSDTASKLSKKDQAALLSDVRDAISKINSTLPFISKSFGEHMENVVEKAKAEVHGYVMGHLVRAGMEALSSPIEFAQTAIEDHSGEE